MNLKHFGDSYDVVKKSLIQLLSPFGPWAAHPMFTHTATPSDAAAFSDFLGVKLVSTKVLLQTSDRRAYFAPCKDYQSIFLDPDTGIRLRSGRDKRSADFIFGDELIELAAAHPKGLVLVFDQSLARGREREQVHTKLEHFHSCGVQGFAYVSHASFLVLGHSSDLVHDAREKLLAASRLPESRIISAKLPG